MWITWWIQVSVFSFTSETESQNKWKYVLQTFWNSLPRHQRGRRTKPGEVDRMQETLQVQEVRGDRRQATNLIQIWTFYTLLLGRLQWNNCVDGGASLPLDFPGGRVRRNPQPVSWIFLLGLYGCFGWPQEVAIPFLVQISRIMAIQLFIICIIDFHILQWLLLCWTTRCFRSFFVTIYSCMWHFQSIYTSLFRAGYW